MGSFFITPLASAQVNHDSISIQLLRPEDMPAVNRTLPQNRAAVRIVWPAAPTIVDAAAFGDVASEVARLFARAHIVLAALRASG